MALAITLPAAAQTAPQWKCTGNPDIPWDDQIAGCTSAIASGMYADKEAARAYMNRGNAWRGKNDLDQAIDDYTEAIRLDPKFALAYGNRGYAWQTKGDLDRAIADYDEAIRFEPNAIRYTNRGLAWQQKDDLERAIADYTEAIRLDPRYVLAYNNRAGAWANKGELERAIADLTEALRLDPLPKSDKNINVYYNRGFTWQAKGELERAIADYSEAIRLDPKNFPAIFARGRANLFAGALPEALADLNLATELNPKYAYSALWLDIARKRSNLPSRLGEASKQVDITKWPGPIIRLFLSQLTPEAVLAAADDGDSNKKNNQVCEANFYIGELALQRTAMDEAARLFRLAVADCPKHFIEYEGATAELKTLAENR